MDWLDQSPIEETALPGPTSTQDSANGLSSMKAPPPPRFPQGAAAKPKAFLFLAIFCAAACTTPPPDSLTFQCVTGAAEWNPITLDFVHRVIGGNPAVITDSEIRWESISRNGFGGATHTQYEIKRGSGTVTVENFYMDPRGNRTIEPGRYVGECYVRHRSF